jgi:hypothetical protein
MEDRAALVENRLRSATPEATNWNWLAAPVAVTRDQRRILREARSMPQYMQNELSSKFNAKLIDHSVQKLNNSYYIL